MGAQRFFKFMLFLFGLVLIASLAFRNSMPGSKTTKDTNYSEFYNQLTAGNVEEVAISENDAQVKIKGQADVTHNVKLPTNWQSNDTLNAAFAKAATESKTQVVIKSPLFGGLLG